MATDLVDGYVDGLRTLGQGHLKTLFLSYLIASSKKSSPDGYDDLFPERNAGTQSETATGRSLRIIAQANAALAKLGQRLHSSGLLKPEDNYSLARLKEDVEDIYRVMVFDWMENAECEAGSCSHVELRDRKGNASVKVVSGAKVDGEEITLYLVKPNASRRADSQFELILHALEYAIKKGHHSLNLMLPIVRRSRERFSDEIDMEKERKRLHEFAKMYRPDKEYNGFTFLTPEVMEHTSSVLTDERALSVKPIRVKRFFDLSPEDQREFGLAVALNEGELSVPSGRKRLRYNVDPHEGNFLLVDDPQYLEDRGLKGKKVILAIDAGMLGNSSSEQTRSVVDVMIQLLVAKWAPQPDSVEKIVAATKSWFPKNAPSTETIRAAVEASTRAAEDPLSLVSRFISEVEAHGHRVADSVVDYKDSLQTRMTWDQHTDKAFTKGFLGSMHSRVRAGLAGTPLEGLCDMILQAAGN